MSQLWHRMEAQGKTRKWTSHKDPEQGGLQRRKQAEVQNVHRPPQPQMWYELQGSQGSQEAKEIWTNLHDCHMWYHFKSLKGFLWHQDHLAGKQWPCVRGPWAVSAVHEPFRTAPQGMCYQQLQLVRLFLLVSVSLCIIFFLCLGPQRGSWGLLPALSLPPTPQKKPFPSTDLKRSN